MADEPDIPPIYELLRVSPYTDAMEHARRIVGEGAADGTLVWSTRENEFDCAVILSAEAPLADSLQIVPVGVLALTDALAASIDPGVKIGFDWPNKVAANLREVGRVVLTVPEDSPLKTTPDWLKLGATVAIKGTPDGDIGEAAGTSLHFERCFDITSRDILERFSRYLLTWVNRWLDEGFEPIRKSWMIRFSEGEEDIGIQVAYGEESVEGMFSGLNKKGDLIVKAGKSRRTLRLSQAILEQA